VAHGAAFTIAAYLFWWTNTVLGLLWPLAAGLAVIAAVVFGLCMERFIYRPIQRHEGAFFTVFIAAFGVQIIVQNLIGTLFGRGFVSVTTPLSHSVQVLPGLFVAPVAALAIVVAVIGFTALTYYLSHTHTGMAMRALSENPDLIRVFGLDPGRVAQYAFAIGSAIVVPGAIFTAMTAGLNPAVGAHVMLISLAATIVGGIGSLRGAAYGGLLLGLAENLALWRLDPQWSEAVTFVVLFLFIIFRPAGFFGRPHAAK
jgi:branched-chain amino acid transport system permease protein